MPTVKEMRKEKKRQEKQEQERVEKEKRDKEIEEEEAKKSKLNNDIKDIRSVKQLEKLHLDFDSPRLLQAMDDLGVKEEEVIIKEKDEFEKKGLDPDVVELRFKHHQNRLVDTLNRVIEQRRQIKMEQARAHNRTQFTGQTTPQSPKENRLAPKAGTSMSVNVASPEQRKIMRGPSNMNLASQKVDRRQVGGSVTLPSIQSPAGHIPGLSLFLTDVKEQPTTLLGINRSGAVSQMKGLSAKESPSRLNLDQIHISPMQAFRNSVNFDQLLEQERKREMKLNQRSKEQVMQNSLDMKSRISLERQINKRFMDHDKKMKTLNKERNDNLGKKAQKYLTVKDNCVKMARMYVWELETEKKFDLDQKNQQKQQKFDKYINEQQDNRDKQLKELEDKRSAVRNQYINQQNDWMMYFEEKQGSLAERLNEGSQRRLGELGTKMNYIKNKNGIQSQRQNEISIKLQEDAFTHYISALKHQDTKDKKTKAIQKKQQDEQMKKKENKAEKMDNMANLKKEEMYKQREQAYELKQKLERSAKVVEDFKKKQAHKNMLQSEQRKLQEDDMTKVHARLKHLATKKKNEILQKEQLDLSNVKEKRKQSQKIVDSRYRNRVLRNITTDKFNQSLDSWAKRGFNHSALAKQDLDLISHIDLRVSKEKEYIKSGRQSMM